MIVLVLVAEDSPTVAKPATRFRWTICALIFFATTVNYLDRQLFSNLVPFFEDDLKLGPTDLALLNVCFILPYGYAMLFVGRFIDKVGTKRGLNLAFLVWSVSSIAHAFVRSLGTFIGVRFALGVGESAMYPTGVKSMTDWFPKKERATAIGFFNAGSNVGAILAPPLAVWIASSAFLGWRGCFLITGALGMVWIFFWRAIYRPPAEHPKVSKSELEYIQADPAESGKQLSFAQLFAMRQVYGLAIAKALTDAPVWFFMGWMPKILVDQFHEPTYFIAYALPVIYIVADLGSIAGGYLSSALVTRGVPINLARKGPMLLFASLVVPVMFVGRLVDHPAIMGIPSVYCAVGLVSLAFGAHQGWSCNLFTLISDTVPQNSMALAVGAINGFAMVGVSIMQFFVGDYVKIHSSYDLPFTICGFLYLVAFVVLQIIVPRVERTMPTKLAKIPLVIAGGVAILAGLGYLQYVVNIPPYRSINDYISLRGKELGLSNPIAGPTAKVGWMEARWYEWPKSDGTAKIDLVKFDTYGHPIIESKGAAAPKYKGPPLATVRIGFQAQ